MAHRDLLLLHLPSSSQKALFPASLSVSVRTGKSPSSTYLLPSTTSTHLLTLTGGAVQDAALSNSSRVSLSQQSSTSVHCLQSFFLLAIAAFLIVSKMRDRSDPTKASISHAEWNQFCPLCSCLVLVFFFLAPPNTGIVRVIA